MRKLIQGALALTAGVALAAALVAAFGGTAQADPIEDCKVPVTVHLANRPDNGSHGLWAKDTIDRTLTVCATDEDAPAGKRWYRAAIIDKGTFVTVAGKSPVAGVDLPAGIEGTVNGGFRAHFKADATWTDWEPDNLSTATPTGEWVKAAFPSAEGTLVGSYVWTYKSPCETYKDSNGVYTGDITKVCVAESPSPSPSTSSPTPSPSATTSAPADPSPTTSPSDPPATTSAPSDPPTSTTPAPVPAGNELPLTGSSGVPTLVLWGLGAVVLGSLLGLFASIRSRRDSTTFTA